jgi:hypothetical protein
MCLDRRQGLPAQRSKLDNQSESLEYESCCQGSDKGLNTTLSL